MSNCSGRRLLIQVGVSKIGKHAARESGDTLEIIERPHGGLSAVLVDGQRSGRSAKIISNIVARKAISLLGEGVRDGAAARATHDYLCTHRGGHVSAEMQMVSVDLVTNTLVISRNSRCPAYVIREGKLTLLDAASVPIGIYDHTKPVITEVSISAETYIILYTDGVGRAFDDCTEDVAAFLLGAIDDDPDAQELADAVLAQALLRESKRPRDDISVLVLAVKEVSSWDGVRRLSVSFPVRALS